MQCFVLNYLLLVVFRVVLIVLVVVRMFLEEPLLQTAEPVTDCIAQALETVPCLPEEPLES